MCSCICTYIHSFEQHPRYLKVHKNNSCVVDLEGGGWREIKYFFTDEICGAIAIIEPVSAYQSSVICNSRLADFIVAFQRLTTLIARPVRDIVRKCVLVDIQDLGILYICRIPNLLESD